MNIQVRTDDHVSIEVIPEDRMIMLTWKGYVPSEPYRSILDQALTNVRSMDLTRWLADLRDMDAILQQDEQWTTLNWFPRLAKTGLQRMVILTSTDYFNQMSVERIITAGTAEMPLSVAYFDDIEKARNWLMSTNKVAESVC